MPFRARRSHSSAPRHCPFSRLGEAPERAGVSGGREALELEREAILEETPEPGEDGGEREKAAKPLAGDAERCAQVAIAHPGKIPGRELAQSQARAGEIGEQGELGFGARAHDRREIAEEGERLLRAFRHAIEEGRMRGARLAEQPRAFLPQEEDSQKALAVVEGGPAGAEFGGHRGTGAIDRLAQGPIRRAGEHELGLGAAKTDAQPAIATGGAGGGGERGTLLWRELRQRLVADIEGKGILGVADGVFVFELKAGELGFDRGQPCARFGAKPCSRGFEAAPPGFGDCALGSAQAWIREDRLDRREKSRVGALAGTARGDLFGKPIEDLASVGVGENAGGVGERRHPLAQTPFALLERLKQASEARPAAKAASPSTARRASSARTASAPSCGERARGSGREEGFVHRPMRLRCRKRDFGASAMRGSRDRELAARLAESEFFGGLDAHVIERLIADASLRELRGGDVLFRVGDPAASMGYVLSGCLGVFASPEACGKPIGRIAAGETVGEMGLISRRARSATVVALRDTELLEFPHAAFERLVDTHPRALLVMARTLIRRLEASVTREHGSKVHTVALLPLGGADATGFAALLAQTLGREDSVWVVGQSEAERPAHFYSELEQAHRFVLYRGEAGASGWNAFCERQADLVLLLARAEEWPLALPPPIAGPWRPRWLIFTHPEGRQRRGILTTEALSAVERVLHWVEAGDEGRIARLLAGQAIGVVFSGGGARGFAHVGMLQALLEAGLEPDVVGGSSIGAVVAAGWAAGWSPEEMIERFRSAFVSSNPLGDLTVPFVALTRGKRVSARLREHFGDWQIEDLRRPFYCVATRLGAGSATVYRTGPLWLALRASIAIPGLLPPVFAEGEVLVDGGVIDNLPVEAMRALAPGTIIGLEVAGGFRLRSAWDETELPALPRMVYEWFRGKRRHDIARILLRAGMVNSAASLEAARAKLDLHLKPPLDGIDLLDWRRFDEIVEVGYRYAQQRLREAQLSRTA